jgi:hypothetical protein
MAKATVQDNVGISDAGLHESKVTFEKYVDSEIPSISPYLRAYLGVTFRGQYKTASDWVKEPEVAKLLKKE